MATILNSANLNSTILDLAILVSPLKLTQTFQDWFPPFAQINFTHSFWLNLMMAAIFNLAILDSAILVFPLKLTHTSQDWFPPFAQKNFTHSSLFTICTKYFTHSIWLTWWWQPSWILPSWIQPFCTKKTSLIHSDSTWWWQPSWTLPCWIQTLHSWIQTPCYLLSDSLKNTLTPLWLWPKLILSDSNSFIDTQLDDGSRLKFCHI